MQSVSPLALVLLVGVAYAGDGTRGAAGYAAARRGALNASSALKARLHARDAATRRAWTRPGRAACAALAEAAVDVDAAWSGYVEALEAVSVAAMGHPRHAESARLAARTAQAERAADVKYTAEWAAWCAALPDAAGASRWQGEPTRRCGQAHLGRAVIRRQAPAAARATSTLDQLRWMAAHFEDTLDFVFVVRMDGVDAPDDAAHVWIDRGTPGLGRAPFDPAHLPAWRRLRGGIVIDGVRRDVARAPTLRALARTFGNRWPSTECPRPLEGWGLSDVGGQLGGGRQVELLGPGRYRVEPVHAGARVGMVGNGGNGLRYAPIEQYLLGHRPLFEVGAVTLLRPARRIGAGIFAADGACVLDAETIRARFGERPPRTAPWRVGVLLVADEDVSVAALRAQLTAVEAFTRAGPDDDALAFNYYEATDGRGRLDWVAPIPRGCPSRARK